MGEMRHGTVIMSPNGGTARIVAIHPQGQKEIFRLKFIDGATCEATGDHLWSVKIVGRKDGNETKILSTNELSERLDRINSREYSITPNILIPLVQKIRFSYSRSLPFDPYVLGLLLGDGCFRLKNSVTITTADQEIIDSINKRGFRTTARKKYAFYLPMVAREIKKLGLMGLGSKNKFIPEEYLDSSINDRMDLLRGLMDTDGYADIRGHCSFYSISENLAKGVQYIVWSLGGKATITKKRTSYTHKGVKKNGQICFSVYIQLPNNADAFYLLRKKKRCEGKSFNGGLGALSRRLVSIESIGKKESQCITIDKPDGLYVTNDFIVTHNSYILRWVLVRQLVKWALEGHTGVRVGLFCENYPALKDRQITKIEKEFPKWLGTLADSQIEGMSFKLNQEYGGGVIALRNLDDVSKYASSEFAIAAVDELTKNQREVFDQLRSIIRWPGIENTKFIGGTNPGEVGHLWVKKLWVDRIFGPEDPPAEQFAFVKSLPTDNVHNSQSYLDELKRLPERLRKAYYDGNWDVFAGQYFSEWDKEQHTCSPFTIPPNWKRFRAYDYGYESPATCAWYALDQDGRVWVYREKYWQKGHKTDAERQAQEIARLSEGETYEYSVADPAIFSPQGIVDKHGGQTIAETFIRNGIPFLPGSNRRIDGWGLMHRYLRWDEHTRPKVIYFNTCLDSIRTIPALVHDERKVEDVDTQGEDHAGDRDRYLLMSLHERVAPAPKTEIEQKLEQMKQQNDISQNLNKFYYE